MGTERAIQVPSDWAARHRSGAAWLDEQLDYLPREIHQVALVAGFGGATGSAVAPELMIGLRARQICARMFCTLPFGFEGESRLRAATPAVERLSSVSIVPHVLRNDSLLYGARGKTMAAVMVEGNRRQVRAIHRFLVT